MQRATLTFEKIVPEGKALGYADGKACFCVGPLPGETAEVEITRDKKRYCEARLIRIIAPATSRTSKTEGHYLACSPWQGVDYSEQLRLKRAMLNETFGRPELRLKVTEMIGAPQPSSYRNKLEFAVRIREGEVAELALHERNTANEFVAAPDGCRLGSEAMNRAALAVLERINRQQLGRRTQSIMVREGSADHSIAVAVRMAGAAKVDWQSLMVPGISGLYIYRADTAGVQHLLWQRGAETVTERLGELELRAPVLSFFQTNPPAFEQALDLIAAAVPAGSTVVDAYGGTGAIGLRLAGTAAQVVGIESDAAAAEVATANADRAGISNYRSLAGPTETHREALQTADVVVVDPPRAGLTSEFIRHLLSAKPERIIYLSCNPATQARDLIALSPSYMAGDVAGLDFYPGTLHLESLSVLTRRT